MLPKNRPPTHPGALLRDIVAETPGLSQEGLARELGVSYSALHLLLREKKALTADMALRLGKRFDMDPHSWMAMQTNLELWIAMRLAQEAEQPGRAVVAKKGSARHPGRRKSARQLAR